MPQKITDIEKTLLLAAVDDVQRLRRGKPVPGVEGWAQERSNYVRHASRSQAG
jgi:hypothetical protein